MDLWQPHTLIPERDYLAQFGPLNLWVKKQEDEIYVYCLRQPEAQANGAQPLAEAPEPPPAGAELSRWIVDPHIDTLQLRPVLPDRAIVVRTGLQVKVPAGKTALFFVSIPLWLRLQTTDSPTTELGDYPTVIRSNIWFGNVVSGELCYSLITQACRHVEEADHPIYKAVCPVKIRNVSKERLDIERFCVHVQHLSLYQARRLLWTNEVTVTFQGRDAASKIDYARQKPSFESNLKLITALRIPLKQKLLKRSLFSFVRQSDL